MYNVYFNPVVWGSSSLLIWPSEKKRLREVARRQEPGIRHRLTLDAMGLSRIAHCDETRGILRPDGSWMPLKAYFKEYNRVRKEINEEKDHPKLTLAQVLLFLGILTITTIVFASCYWRFVV